MNKKEFVTIFQTYSNTDVVKQTLPSIISESKKNNSGLIVYDTTEIHHGRNKKWKYLQNLNDNKDFFLILSDNLSVADSRNTCLYLAKQIYLPDYICIIDDDHGFKPGIIKSLVNNIKKYYGKLSPNGLRYGLFTGCLKHRHGQCISLSDGNMYPDKNLAPGRLGGTNGCFRCAPTHHWENILKGYDSDEYLISVFQTSNINKRNYNKGFTVLIVDGGKKCFCVDHDGRGTSNSDEIKMWDDKYTASDKRANFVIKK